MLKLLQNMQKNKFSKWVKILGQKTLLSIRLPLEREKTIRDSITHFAMLLWRLRASLVVQLVKNLPATWEIPVRLLGQEGPLEKGMATHSSILAWRVPGL